MIGRAVLLLLAFAAAAAAQPAPALRLAIAGPPERAIEGARPGCDATDIPDAPARAIRLATDPVLHRPAEVQLYATDSRNRVERGPGLLQVRHDCTVVMTGAGQDDPAAFNDRAWIASPWTPDGRTIWAVVHNEFHGHRRPAICPTRRYMDCWYNALTAAVSHDGGRSFDRVPGLVAALPYRFDELGRGHHGYFNPSNIVTFQGAQYMFAFATRAGLQRSGNCLLRTTSIATPASWRAWDGTDFRVAFIDPYAPGPRIDPAPRVCAPVALGGLRWPVTSLVRHAPSGLFIAIMMNGARGGGVFYATSPDLLSWSSPALLMQALGEGAWTCEDPPPLAFPSLLDPSSPDHNFETVGPTGTLFATRFNIGGCRTSLDRDLVRWPITVN